MTAVSLAGAPVATALRVEVAERVALLDDAGHRVTVAVVTTTDDPSSEWYVQSVAKAADRVGIACSVVSLGPSASADDIARQLDELSVAADVDAIVLQTPLPAGVRGGEVAAHIAPHKDIDGANPSSLGRPIAGVDAFAPATAEAVMRLLEHHEVPLAAREAVVVGRSLVVGKPLAHLMLQRDATVTIAHSRTRDLPRVTRRADILVAAVGRAHLLTPEHVGVGAVVVDVGTNVTRDGSLAGDVDPSVGEYAGALSPVPGGVGPVTTAVLLAHAVDAAESRRGHAER